MASLRARSLFLLDSSAVKFDLSGVDRRSKHDVFKGRYQLGEFHHLHNEPRKDPTVCFEQCNLLPSAFNYIGQDIQQHISHSSVNFQKTIPLEERLFVTLRSV